MRPAPASRTGVVVQSAAMEVSVRVGLTGGQLSAVVPNVTSYLPSTGTATPLNVTPPP
jgi:hypothetical protein